MRQQRNRAQRARAEAKSERAGEATAISRGDAEPVTGGADRTERVDDRKVASGRTTAADTNPSPREQRRQERARVLAERYPIPGQRWVMMALLFSVVSVGMLLITPLVFSDEIALDTTDAEERQALVDAADEDDGELDGVIEVPAEDDGEEPTEVAVDAGRSEVDDAIAAVLEEGDDEGTFLVPVEERIVSRLGPFVSLGLGGLPVLITGVAFWGTKHSRRTTIWTTCLILYAGYFFLFGSQLSILPLPALIALMVGNYQSRKAETMARIEEQQKAKAAAGDDEVIDVDGEEVLEADEVIEVDGADRDDD